MLTPIFNESQLNHNDNSLGDNIIRCPKCYLIPFISIEHLNKETKLNSKCLNNHIINKPIKELYYENKNNKINIIKCKNCEEIDCSKLYYCIKCYGFYCEKENHSLKEGHNILISINKIDSCCLEEEHNNYNVNHFCFSHNKNICDRCTIDEHEKDNFKKFDFLKKKEIQLIQDNIKIAKDNLMNFLNNINLLISDLEKLIQEIKREFNVFKENKELEIKLSQDLINVYILKNKENNLNYQIIENVRNISFKNIPEFNLNKIETIKKEIMNQFDKNFIEFKQSQKQQIKSFNENNLMYENERKVNIQNQFMNMNNYY